MIIPKQGTYVAGLAARWAATNPGQQWIHQAPDSPVQAEELTADTISPESISDYLDRHNPFPDGSRVEVATRNDAGDWKSVVDGVWEPAEILERVAPDEWIVEYPDGEQGFRDPSELRAPRTAETERT